MRGRETGLFATVSVFGWDGGSKSCLARDG